MLNEDDLIAPGALFHAVRKPSTLMRINFSPSKHLVGRKRPDQLEHQPQAQAGVRFGV
jgi:hypothetical protein